MPKNLDSALRIALQLEVWTKDVDRVRLDLQKDRRNREVTKAEPKKQELTEALSKRITELEKQLAEVRNSKSIQVRQKELLVRSNERREMESAGVVVIRITNLGDVRS